MIAKQLRHTSTALACIAAAAGACSMRTLSPESGLCLLSSVPSCGGVITSCSLTQRVRFMAGAIATAHCAAAPGSSGREQLASKCKNCGIRFYPSSSNSNSTSLCDACTTKSFGTACGGKGRLEGSIGDMRAAREWQSGQTASELYKQQKSREKEKVRERARKKLEREISRSRRTEAFSGFFRKLSGKDKEKKDSA